MNNFERGISKLLLAQLSELYHCENRLLHPLRRMAEAARAPSLKEMILQHQRETVTHVERLTQAFALLGERPKAYPCRTVDGLIEDGTWLLHTLKDEAFLDDAIVNACHRTEMLEASSYTSAMRLARQLGLDQVADLCQASLQEEVEAARRFNVLAEQLGKDPVVNGRH